MGVQITKLAPVKTAIAKTVPIGGFSAARIRPVAANSKVTSIKPGTLRIMPQGMPTAMKHPGQPVSKAISLKNVRPPR